MDLSMQQPSAANQSMILNDNPHLMQSGPNSIFVGSAKPGTAYGTASNTKHIN